MKDCDEIVAFIPVRGGSKSIPLKNIQPIFGRPLIYWTLDASVGCPGIDKVYVSTDSQEIRDVVNAYGSSKVQVIDRSQQTATDTATTESAMLEFAVNYQFRAVILIQATSPLLDKDHLEKGICLYHMENVDSVMSIVRQKRFIWENNGMFITPVNYNPLCRPRRQDHDGYLVENGAFYITSRDALLKTGCRVSGNIAFIEMPDETYFELDEPTDWIIIDELLKNKHS